MRAAGASQLRDRVFRGSELQALEALAVAVEAGDSIALDAIDSAAEYIGIATANVVNILNPDVVVLGGALPRTIPYIVDRIRDQVRRQAIAVELAGLDVVASSLGEEAVALGGAALVLGTAGFVDRVARRGAIGVGDAQVG